MATVPEPYVDLMAPGWQARAALAIAADLCDRHGIQDEMQRLDPDMRLELVRAHAGRIASEFERTFPAGERPWREPGRDLPGMVELVAEPAVPPRLLVALDHAAALLMMIETAAKADDFSNPVASLAFIQGLAKGGQHALYEIRGPALDMQPGAADRRTA